MFFNVHIFKSTPRGSHTNLGRQRHGHARRCEETHTHTHYLRCRDTNWQKHLTFAQGFTMYKVFFFFLCTSSHLILKTTLRNKDTSLKSFTLTRRLGPDRPLQPASPKGGAVLARGCFSPPPPAPSARPGAGEGNRLLFPGGAQLVTARGFTPRSTPLPGPASPPGSGGAAPPAEAAWAEDVRHGARGRREGGGGTWNPRPVAGSPGSKISEGWGRGAHTAEGLGCAPPVPGWETGLSSVLLPPPPSPHPTVFGAIWDGENNLSR